MYSQSRKIKKKQKEREKKVIAEEQLSQAVSMVLKRSPRFLLQITNCYCCHYHRLDRPYTLLGSRHIQVNVKRQT